MTDTVNDWAVSRQCDVPALVRRGGLHHPSEPLALLPSEYYDEPFHGRLLLDRSAVGRRIRRGRKTCGGAQAHGGMAARPERTCGAVRGRRGRDLIVHGEGSAEQGSARFIAAVTVAVLAP